MDSTTEKRPTAVVRRVGGVLLLAVAYVCTAKAGLAMDAVSGFATLVWAPTGISIAALWVLGLGYWPGIFAGAAIVNWWTGAPVVVALCIGLGNTLEAVASVWVLRRLGDIRPSLRRVRDVLALVGVAGFGGTALSASVGVAALAAAGIVKSGEAGATWRAWWLGDLIGVLVVAPPLLTWRSAGKRIPHRYRLLEAILLVASTAVVAGWIFRHGEGDSPAPFRDAYVFFTVLAWAAIRFGQRGGSLETLAVCALAIAGTALGRGPFAHGRLSDALTSLQAFMSVAAATTLILGAVTEEREIALEAQQDLLAMVSHDMRNMLSAVRMSIDLMVRAPAERIASAAAPGRSAAKRMELLIRDLLDLSEIRSGRFTIEASPVEVSALLGETTLLATALTHGSGVILQNEEAPKVSVLCDSTRIVQVLANVLGNAAKFTPRGGSITLRTDVAGAWVRFSVSDTGPGIGPEDLPRLFDRYWRGSTPSSGSGLGLFIAKTIVLAHGGTIWAESEPGAGTTIRFTLPIASARS